MTDLLGISRSPVGWIVLLHAACSCTPAPPTIVYVLPNSGGAPQVREIETPPARESSAGSRLQMDQRTPREALRSFVRAFDAGRYDLLLGFIPHRDRVRDGDELTEERLRQAWQGPQKAEVESLIEALRQAVDDAPIEENGS